VQDTIISFNETTLDPNATIRGFGGGIATIGPLTVTHSYLINNKSRYGGGLFVGEGASPMLAQIYDSVIQFNRVLYSGGGLYTSSDTTVLLIGTSLIEGNEADYGGGIARNKTYLTIFQSAIGDNTATRGGGLASGPSSGQRAGVYDSTFYSNVVTTTQGGGIYNDGLIEVRNLTLEGNTTGVYNTGAFVEMQMANTVLHSLGANCSGSLVTSRGGNFSSDLSCLFGAVDGNEEGTNLDPLLSPLMSNLAGTAKFFMPLPSSPLINTATYECSAVDQRGAQRPDACDKGAVEFGGLLARVLLPLLLR
jgi:hypothetical protein